MTDRHDRPGSLTQLQGSVLRTNTTDARKLPEPGEKWLAHKIGIDAGAIKKFQQAGLIKKREYEGRVTNRHFWETTKGVHEWLEAREDGQKLTPCGHATGIRTIEPGTYTCTCNDCECRMDRETAAEVVT